MRITTTVARLVEESRSPPEDFDRIRQMSGEWNLR